MKPEDFHLVAQLCAERAGLAVDARKTYFIESRLGPVARREGFGSVDELVARLSVQDEDRLVWSIVEAMAVGETAFFRDRKPFEIFASEILPDLARRRSGEPIRVWSAACGAGQEIYSLAMVVDETLGDLPTGTRVELFGSDLSDRALEKAQSGLYTQFEIQRGLPIRRVVRHFEKVDDNWKLSPKIRQMVRWRRINLISDQPASGQFDVIFCRYLLSAMTEAAAPVLLSALARALSPDGVLVLGEGEGAGVRNEMFRSLPNTPDAFARDPAAVLAA